MKLLDLTFDMRIDSTEHIINNLIEVRDNDHFQISIFYIEEHISTLCRSCCWFRQSAWQAKDLWSTHPVRDFGCWIVSLPSIHCCKNCSGFIPTSEPCGRMVLYSSSHWLITTRASVIELNTHRSRHVVRKIELKLSLYLYCQGLSGSM